jgi:asparagine synthase (glutamine-hydrolysing)
MCGITGICHISRPGPVSLNLLERMTGALGHRGPDGTGVYLDDWAGLGHTRLSIIDLSGGAQPIHNEDETLWIVYNGEIFNYPELRENLIGKGHRFYTGTDTEVILHLYEDQGAACLDQLNGQFAFAIWDAKKKELFLARDRVGILPLHYTVHGDALIFASEIKSIFAVEGVERTVDPIAMDQIFTFWTTLPGRTAFQDIHEVPAGHYLKVTGGKVDLRRYWDLPFYPPEEHTSASVRDICSELTELIIDAVRIRLRADVPVGCYLSGGLDSSGITTIVRSHFNNDLRTFGIRFEESEFDESEYQQFMVATLGTAHTNVLATNSGIGSSLNDVLRHCEKPLLRTAPVPLFLLSRAVRQNDFKVVLTGEGADEVFGGYNIFREAKVRRFWARQPESKSRPLLIGKLYPYIFSDNPRARHFVRTFFGGGLADAENPFFSHLVRWNNTGKTKTFFSDELRRAIGDYSCYDDLRERLPGSFDGWDYLSKAQYLETALFMSNYLLSSQGDRVSMANAVEIRPPYLDHRILEFMGRVPSKLKIKGLNEKYILKGVFRGRIPDRILMRPKHPYRAPIKESLLTAMSPTIDRYLSPRSLHAAGLFDPAKTTMLINKLQRSPHAGEVDNMALAGILSSQMIYDLFVGSYSAGSVRPVTPNLVIDRRTAPVS